MAAAHPLPGDRPEAFAGARRSDVGGGVGHPRHHPEDVAIHRRVGQLEGDAGDGGCGIVADPRQRADGRIVARETARGHHLPGGAPQIAGARIISQAGPQRQHILFLRRRQRFHRGEAIEEALVIRDDGLRAGLLQHDLGNPDAVGVGGAPPGQIAMAAAVPGEQPLHSRTRSHSATTAKSCGSTSQASNSGFRGSRRMRSWRHSSPSP